MTIQREKQISKKINEGDLKMSGDLRYINSVMNPRNFGESEKVNKNKREEKKSAEKEMPLVHESCNLSGFGMAAVAGALLLFAGIFLYALII